jgi:hypothetical protein
MILLLYENLYVLGTSPNKVTAKNQDEVFAYMYRDLIARKKAGKEDKPKFSVHDKVKISRTKILFEKGTNIPSLDFIYELL